MKSTVFRGSACAIITPLKEDGSVNYSAFDSLIEEQIVGKTDAIVVMGTTGEASAFNDEDHLAVIGHCVKVVKGRIPVIAGCGGNDTAHAVTLSKRAEKLGADALLQVTPYYNKTSQAGLIRHFTAIADATNVPIILYNVPSRTGMTIQAETYLELSQHPRIVATKEASGDISLIAKTAALCGEALQIYSGNDDQVLPILSLGGIGVISVVANVAPRHMHDLCQAYLDGNPALATRQQLELIPLCEALFCDVNPIPVKEALNQMGMDAGPLRLPLCETTPEKKQKIGQILHQYNLL